MSHLPEAIDWGCPNKIYQPVLAPTASKRAREKTGDYVPARPDWICITAPEHDASFAPGSTKEPTEAELIAMEARAKALAEKRRIMAIERQAKAEIRHQEWLKRKAAEKEAREKQATANKAKGWGNKKRKPQKLTEEAKIRKRDKARELSARRIAERDKKLFASIPIGYVKLTSLKLKMSRSALTVAAKEGRILGVKIMEVWYCDPKSAIHYVDTVADRKRERAAYGRSQMNYAEQSRQRKRGLE